MMKDLNKQALSKARQTVAAEFSSSMDLNDEKISNVTLIFTTCYPYIHSNRAVCM